MSTMHFLFVFKQSLEDIITINGGAKQSILISRLAKKVSKINEWEAPELNKIEQLI